VYRLETKGSLARRLLLFECRADKVADELLGIRDIIKIARKATEEQTENMRANMAWEMADMLSCEGRREMWETCYEGLRGYKKASLNDMLDELDGREDEILDMMKEFNK